VESHQGVVQADRVGPQPRGSQASGAEGEYPTTHRTNTGTLTVARSIALRSVGIGLNVCGFLEWVERADFHASFALNTRIIPLSTDYAVSDAGLACLGA